MSLYFRLLTVAHRWLPIGIQPNRPCSVFGLGTVPTAARPWKVAMWSPDTQRVNRAGPLYWRGEVIWMTVLGSCMRVLETQHTSMARDSKVLFNEICFLSDEFQVLKASICSLEGSFRRLKSLWLLATGDKGMREGLVVKMEELLRDEGGILSWTRWPRALIEEQGRLLLLGCPHREKIFLVVGPENKAGLVVILVTWECVHRLQGTIA